MDIGNTLYKYHYPVLRERGLRRGGRVDGLELVSVITGPNLAAAQAAKSGDSSWEQGGGGRLVGKGVVMSEDRKEKGRARWNAC